MVEILFGESEAASMKVAKNTNLLEGVSKEVICLGFLLDIGDIRKDIDSQYRKDLIYSMFAQEQWGKEDDLFAELWKLGDFYCNELNTLKNYLDAGKQIRIWYNDDPYAMCGLCHLCSILQSYDNEVFVINLPSYTVNHDSVVTYPNWSEVSSQEFAEFLPYEKELSREEIHMYTALWDEMKEDNSPLRAVVNGQLIGVPEEFYDFLIWRTITKEPVKEVKLISDILCANQISVNDWWYIKRIDLFIKQGKIKIVKDSDNKYARIISLA